MCVTLILVTIFVCGSLSEPLIEITDYYWREYTGVIPSDALSGGIDESGSPTYIGQIFCKICQTNSPGTFTLLPATIRPGSQTATGTAYAKVVTSDKLVKILCSRNPQKYQWIAIKNENAHLLTLCHAVIGGTELGYVLNIARVYHGLETVIGKVFASHAPNHGLYVPNNDKEAQYQSYELLTYNCNVSSLNMTNMGIY